MSKLNQKITVVEKVAAPVATGTKEEIEKKIEKMRAEDERNAEYNPKRIAVEAESRKVTSKEKDVHIKQNRDSNFAKGVAKNVSTYMKQSNKHLLRHQQYVADKGGLGGVVLIGTTDKPELWVPDQKVDVQNSPVVVTLEKRSILEKFVNMFRTIPEHYLIDHLNVQHVFTGTTFDEIMTVSLIIDDFYWNSFSERVPKDVRGFHILPGKSGISITENSGYHTLEMIVRMSIQMRKGVEPTKKELQNSYKASAASLFTSFKMENQKLLRDSCREPTETSYPIRIEDEHIIPARDLEDGEEVTKTGVILTPLVPSGGAWVTRDKYDSDGECLGEEEVFVPMTGNSSFGGQSFASFTSDKEYAKIARPLVKVFDIKNPFSWVEEQVPMISNMDWIIGDKIPKAAAEMKEAADSVSKGISINVGSDTKEVVEELQKSLNSIKEQLNNIKVDHKVSFDTKSIFSGMFDSVLDKIRFVLPEEKTSRELLVGLIIAVIYVWAVKNGHKKFMYLGLALSTAVAHWVDSPNIATYCGALFGINGAIDLLPVIQSLFMSEEEEEKVEMTGDSLLSSVTESYVPSVLVHAIIAYVGAVVINVSPNPYAVLYECTIFNKLLNGLELTTHTLADAFIQLVNAFASPWGVKIFRSCYTKYPEAFIIVDGMNAIKDKFLEGQRISRVDYDKFKSLCSSLNQLDKTIPMKNEMRVYRTQVDYAKRMQANLEDKFKIMGIVSGGVRAAPYMTTLVSDPGYGKSVLTPAITGALAPLVLEKSEYEEFLIDSKSFVVSVNPGDEYQEQVKPGHAIYHIDDFMQMKNKNADPKVCHGKWLISFNNNAEAVTNKAFGDKGTVFYTPRWGIINTNVKSFKGLEDQMSTNNVNAVGRRMGDVWRVEIDEEYREYLGPNHYRLDESKTNGIETHFYSFVPDTFMVDPNNGIKIEPLIKQTLRYDDFLKVTAIRYLSHHVHQEIILGQIKDAHKNSKLSPWVGMTGLEIAMSLADEEVCPIKVPNRFSSSADILKFVTKLNLSPELSEKVMSIKFRKWANVLHDRSSAFVIVFVGLMTDAMLEGLEYKIESLIGMQSDDILIEANYWNKKYADKDVDYIRSKENVKKGPLVIETFTEAKTRFLGLFGKMEDAEPMYDSCPEFFDTFMANQEKYLKWIGDSNYPFQLVANARILGSRLMNPGENLDLFFRAIRQTFVAVSATARRLTKCMVDVLNAAVMSTTWKGFIADPYKVICDHISNFVIDMKAYGSDIYNCIAFGLPFSHTFVSAMCAVATFVTGAAMTNVLEMISNSILKVRHHPKASKPIRLRPKVVTVKPVIHHVPVNGEVIEGQKGDADFIASRDLEMIGNARYWNDEVKAIEKAAIENNYALLYDGKLVSNSSFVHEWSMLVHDHTARPMLETCVPGTTFSIVDVRGRATNVLFGDCDVVRFPQEDFAIITLNKSSLGARRSLVDKHITQAELTELQRDTHIDCLLLYYMKEDDERVIKHIPVRVETKFMSYDDLAPTPMLVYSVEGHGSACMSPLIVCDDRYKNINGIIGYHTSGNRVTGHKKGASRAVTRELLVDMLEAVKVQKGLPSVVKIPMTRNSQIPDEIPITGYKDPLSQSTYCKIVKTVFHGFMHDENGCQVPYDKVPSISSPYSITIDDEEVTHWPYYNCLETCVSDTPAISSTIADFATAMYTYTWDSANIEPEVPSVWSINDAINGRGMVGPDSRKSSVGQELRYRGITKKAMYGEEGIRSLETPLMQELCRELEADMEKLLSGELPDWMFLGFIKSEMVNPKKWLEGLFRWICAVDWKEHITCKRLFGHALHLAVKNSITNGMLMGMNPYSEDVNVMGKIMEVFKLICDGDYKLFDKRFFQWLFEQFSTFCRHIYYNGTEQEHRARDMIIAKLASPEVIVIVHEEGVPKAVVIQLSNVLASGHTLTQFLGCFGNSIMDRYSYLMSWCRSIGTTHLEYDVKFHPKPDLVYEEKNMHVFVLGDDNEQCFKEERYGHNCIVNQQNMSEMGVTYTPSDKSEKFVVNWRRLGEAGILKRVIQWDEEEGKYIAPIEEASILGSIYFTSSLKTLPQTIDTALQEAAIRGEVYHSRFSYYLRKRAVEVDYPLCSPYFDYKIARSFVFNSAYLPWGATSTEIVDDSGARDA